MTEQQHDPDRFAAGCRFPARMDPPTTSGGAELGAPVQLYSTEARPFPAPNAGLADEPPVVASGAGWVGCCVAGESRRPSDRDRA